MEIGIKVGDVMTRNFVSISPSSSLVECTKEMLNKKVGSLIVQEGSHLLGILTEGDIIRAIAKKKDLAMTNAKAIMSKRVVTIKPDKDMYNALVVMKKKKIRWLPVVVKKKIIGILTMKDILRIEPALFDIFIEATEIKEKSAKLRSADIGKKEARERAAMASGVTWIKEGDCHECGAYGILYNIDGRLLCEDCKDRLGE